jgi:hypothetical protein
MSCVTMEAGGRNRLGAVVNDFEFKCGAKVEMGFKRSRVELVITQMTQQGRQEV